ncbi:uncharacterized protein LOC125814108 [Solanum verrucosum]|uniref:uncharacterized protein LOC125814108 n=1 Tax=Solanum verrucosum TaxID=315347 RepID=UPI0020D1DD14|nr:uncharacterized protein LOC125814108 [Solanum verrucosum]
MHDYINAEDTELWDIILDGPYIPTKEVKDGELTTTVVKTRKEYNEMDRKKIEKNYKAKKILVCGIGSDEYNRISACESAKEIWDCLQTAHEGTQRVKESKVDMLTTQYENFCMKEGETIFEMNSRFTSITNELRCLGEPIPLSKQVRKILKILPKSWESKVDAITEAKDLKTLSMDELIGNLQTYELNKKQGTNMKEGKKEKFIALKNSQNDATQEEDEMAYVTKSQKQETQNFKPRKRDLVPDSALRKAHANQLVRKAFAVWGNDSSESEEDAESYEDVSMMAIKEDENVFNFIFSLMANSDYEEDSDKVTLFYLKDDLDNLPIENLRKLAALLIDCVDERTTENLMWNKKLSLCEDKNSALMSKLSIRIGILENDSLEPSEGPGTSVGGKRKLSILEEELEEKLKILESNFNGKKRLGRRPIEPPYNPHSKYVYVSDNLLCTHCGRNGHLKEKCVTLRKAKEKHEKFVRSKNNDKRELKGPGPRYRFRKNTLPPGQEVCIIFATRKNEVKFISEGCVVTNCAIKKIVMSAKKVKNVYVVDLDSTEEDNLSCLSSQTDDANLWHRRLGHVSTSLLNKLVAGDLVRGLPKLMFSNDKICDACAKGKQTRFSFKAKKGVSTTRPLELLHMNLCEPVRIQS